MRRSLVAGVLGAAMLVPAAPVAEAGCVCPELSDIDVGDLQVAHATVRSQKWIVAENRIEAELVLRGVSARTTIDALVLGAPPEDYDEFLKRAKWNRQPGNKVVATATVPGATLSAKLSERDSKVRARWAIGDVATGDVKVRLSWEIPTAGSDGQPKEPAHVAEFCIDAGTMRAIDERVVGFRRVDLVLSRAMATDLTLVIKRDTLPVSLCARNVKKKDAHTFEIRGRKNLQDKNGQLPILFSATI